MSLIHASSEPDFDAGDRERLLAELLESLIEEARSGRPPEIEAAVAAHPELAGDLRELWATAMIAEDMGSTPGGLIPNSAGAASASRESAGSSAGVQIPQQIGDYELIEEIGRGGMGVVFKARQQSLGREVALKMILRGALASDSDVARFRVEAESAARLDHPHIVPVYEVGDHDGAPFFSMRYVEGTTLAERLQDGPLPPREAAELLAPVCRAIEAAHQQGLLHRDLKPSNILIDADGRSYVSDFGLAKRVEPSVVVDAADAAAENSSPSSSALERSITQSGAILGTPGYMAPEQAAGRRGEVSPATDVYSLGAILYAMLTGRAPFQAAGHVETILLVLEQDPLPPRLLNPRADGDLEMIALKCLQKPAELRYQSAAALADDLEARLAGNPVSARSTRLTQVLSRLFRETHHAGVLENWGLLWMWHSLVLVSLCLATNAFQLLKIDDRLPYLGIWVLGAGVWARIFWMLRRRAGPITFVERQIAHIWAGSMIAATLLFAVEWLLDFPVLRLSPVLALISGMVFLAKAGILSGAFYVPAAALFGTAVLMCIFQPVVRGTGLPDLSITLYGFVSGASFFFPGLKYFLQQRRGNE